MELGGFAAENLQYIWYRSRRPWMTLNGHSMQQNDSLAGLKGPLRGREMERGRERGDGERRLTDVQLEQGRQLAKAGPANMQKLVLKLNNISRFS